MDFQISSSHPHNLNKFDVYLDVIYIQMMTLVIMLKKLCLSETKSKEVVPFFSDFG